MARLLVKGYNDLLLFNIHMLNAAPLVLANKCEFSELNTIADWVTSLLMRPHRGQACTAWPDQAQRVQPLVSAAPLLACMLPNSRLAGRGSVQGQELCCVCLRSHAQSSWWLSNQLSAPATQKSAEWMTEEASCRCRSACGGSSAS